MKYMEENIILQYIIENKIFFCYNYVLIMSKWYYRNYHQIIQSTASTGSSSSLSTAGKIKNLTRKKLPKPHQWEIVIRTGYANF